MSLDKAIAHGKERRKPYRGAKAVDATCRNHGSCKWCEENRRHKMRDKLDSISTEEDLFPELRDEEKAQNKEIAKNYPCITCIWSPPSSTDGKPCCACDPDDPMMSAYERRTAMTDFTDQAEKDAFIRCINMTRERPQTNGDRIRQMSDEELLRRLDYSGLCRDEMTLEDCEKHNGNCNTCLLDWLGREASDG